MLIYCNGMHIDFLWFSLPSCSCMLDSPSQFQHLQNEGL